MIKGFRTDTSCCAFRLLVAHAHFGREYAGRKGGGKDCERLCLSSASSRPCYFLRDLLQSDDPDAWNLHEQAQGDECRDMYQISPEELEILNCNRLGPLGCGYMPGAHDERVMTHAYALLRQERHGRERKPARPYRSTRAKTSASSVIENTSRANTSKSTALITCRRNGSLSVDGAPAAATKQSSNCKSEQQDNSSAPLMHMRRAYGALLKIGIDGGDAEWQVQGMRPCLEALGEICDPRAVVDKLVLAHDVSMNQFTVRFLFFIAVTIVVQKTLCLSCLPVCVTNKA